MGLMWFCLGLLVGLSAFGASELHKRFDLVLLDYMIVGAGFCFEGHAAEGEPRAANMGLFLFGAPGVAVLALSTRLFVLPSERRSES